MHIQTPNLLYFLQCSIFFLRTILIIFLGRLFVGWMKQYSVRIGEVGIKNEYAPLSLRSTGSLFDSDRYAVRPDATLYRIYLSSYVRRISIPTLSLQCPQTDCQPYILQKKTKVETSARPKRRLVRYTGTFKKICQNSWKSRVFFKKMLFFQFLQMKSLPLFC